MCPLPNSSPRISAPAPALTHKLSGNSGSINDKLKSQSAIQVSRAGLEKESSSVSGYLPGKLLEEDDELELELELELKLELELELDSSVTTALDVRA